jgi:hypothetical protein
MGITNLDELQLDTNLANAELAAPNAEDTIHFFVAGAQSAGALKAAAIVGKAGTITDVRAYVDTAPVGAALIVDVNINGVTAFTTQANRPTIADGQKVSSTTAPDVIALAAGDRLSIDVDQIGVGVAGSDLMVSITIKRPHVA